MVFCFVEQPLTSQRRQNTTSHINTFQHINTYQHTQKNSTYTKHIFLFSTDTGNFTPSGTRLAQESIDNSFLHVANMFARQGTDQGPRTLALKASQGSVYRESQLDERSLSLLLRSVIEREDKEREMKRDREKERRMRGERHKKRETRE